MVWGDLVHLGTMMWEKVNDELVFDDAVWYELTQRMSDRRLNMILIDLGEGIVYPSHPELAVKGSWTPERLRKELARLRSLGLEPLPKLNFSTAHLTWARDWRLMVSTQAYHGFCADLVRDVCELFDHPRWFHIGYDEENWRCQQKFPQMITRQGSLWWSDFYRLVGEVEKRGSRAWIWSDFLWHHEEEFLKKMPKSVLQSNWYYWPCFDLSKQGAERLGDPEQFKQRAYLKLEAAGFDQVPTGSNWNNDTNFGATVKFCREVIAPERLKGFLTAPWTFTVPRDREKGLRAVEQVGECIV